jgi:threonine/homoserine/homoserine lactone efflux protein
MTAPPDTTAWYHAAYAWVSAVYIAYFASLAIRARGAQRRLESTARGGRG